jgi:hypothetical protein
MGGTAAETLSCKDANLVSTRQARAVAELKTRRKSILAWAAGLRPRSVMYITVQT